MKRIDKELCSYYGGLFVKEENDKFYWGLESYDDVHFTEIRKELYQALLRHQELKEKEIERRN